MVSSVIPLAVAMQVEVPSFMSCRTASISSPKPAHSSEAAMRPVGMDLKALERSMKPRVGRLKPLVTFCRFYQSDNFQSGKTLLIC